MPPGTQQADLARKIDMTNHPRRHSLLAFAAGLAGITLTSANGVGAATSDRADRLAETWVHGHNAGIEQTFTGRSFRLPAPSSVGGTSRGLVRRS
jgi:hypothetical protein